MVDANGIIQGKASLHTLDPPFVSGLFLSFPVIQRVPPHLAGCRESIRRAACDRTRHTILVHLEHLRICPRIRTVDCHIDWKISDDRNSLLIGIRFQFVPLTVKLIFQELVVFHLFFQFFFLILYFLRTAFSQFFRPGCPQCSVLAVLDRTEQTVWFQPFLLFFAKCLEFLIR